MKTVYDLSITDIQIIRNANGEDKFAALLQYATGKGWTDEELAIFYNYQWISAFPIASALGAQAIPWTADTVAKIRKQFVDRVITAAPTPTPTAMVRANKIDDVLIFNGNKYKLVLIGKA